jgi:hypothetical protein
LRAYVEGCGFGLQLCVVLHVLGHSWVISPWFIFLEGSAWRFSLCRKRLENVGFRVR